MEDLRADRPQSEEVEGCFRSRLAGCRKALAAPLSRRSTLPARPDKGQGRAGSHSSPATGRCRRSGHSCQGDERLPVLRTFHQPVGGNPFQTTLSTPLIHPERDLGIWFAMGGTGAIVDALVRLFADMGGNVRSMWRSAKSVSDDTGSVTLKSAVERSTLISSFAGALRAEPTVLAAHESARKKCHGSSSAPRDIQCRWWYLTALHRLYRVSGRTGARPSRHHPVAEHGHLSGGSTWRGSLRSTPHCRRSPIQALLRRRRSNAGSPVPHLGDRPDGVAKFVPPRPDHGLFEEIPVRSSEATSHLNT